jgi:hypothetical protein
MVDEILVAIKEPACPVPVFNLKLVEQIVRLVLRENPADTCPILALLREAGV